MGRNRRDRNESKYESSCSSTSSRSCQRSCNIRSRRNCTVVEATTIDGARNQLSVIFATLSRHVCSAMDSVSQHKEVLTLLRAYPILSWFILTLTKYAEPLHSSSKGTSPIFPQLSTTKYFEESSTSNRSDHEGLGLLL